MPVRRRNREAVIIALIKNCALIPGRGPSSGERVEQKAFAIHQVEIRSVSDL